MIQLAERLQNIYLAGTSLTTWGHPVRAHYGPNNQDAFVAKIPNNPTLITLVSFKAKAGRASIRLDWETASEMDNAGFHVWRSTKDNGEYERLTEQLISAEGSGMLGASYRFEDRAVEWGQTYWYKLEDLDLKGQSKLHGPVSTTFHGFIPRDRP